jgi:hypothetical protein
LVTARDQSGDEQTRLAAALNTILSADGFQAVIVAEKSRHALYAIQWTTLAQWWQKQQNLTEATDATRSLYRRLLRSVKATSSILIRLRTCVR